ncbi:N-formylglutamate amidohydrolase [Roseomonas sp. NAR14]|uniref:N-formylglutamate amidohydrolase n=1 Tax=Roseomonas acroporae TaxID=2937791 RepID=A0A9X1Y636_9PROT|nr:N-formylglutamate amidohydrolase [Roseomonas acroporae]MCK8784659.1 N-formylglutamate amidohydrolase [Roseomonas acroporae]
MAQTRGDVPGDAPGDGPEDAPPPVTAVNEAGDSPYVLLCEHASNHIPAAYARLGLEARELERHIAYDIGAAAMARRLSALLDAPLFLSGYSRLLIDCNRPLGTPTSIPVRSEATDIPGNAGLDQAERDRRAARFFTPFHARVAACLDARRAAGRPTFVVGVHSFTPIFLGETRPWHCGILYGKAADFAEALIAGLRDDPSLVVGDNEPYKVEAEYDYTVPVHGDARGLPAALIEVRQDLIAREDHAAAWADRLAPVLRAAA